MVGTLAPWGLGSGHADLPVSPRASSGSQAHVQTLPSTQEGLLSTCQVPLPLPHADHFLTYWVPVQLTHPTLELAPEVLELTNKSKKAQRAK